MHAPFNLPRVNHVLDSQKEHRARFPGEPFNVKGYPWAASMQESAAYRVDPLVQCYVAPLASGKPAWTHVQRTARYLQAWL